MALWPGHSLGTILLAQASFALFKAVSQKNFGGNAKKLVLEHPYIVLHPVGSVQLQRNLPSSVRANLSAIVSRYWDGLTYYRSDGSTFSMCPSDADLPAPTLANRVLSFVYNPTRDISVVYTEVGRYEIQALKKTILEYVGRDDDILTQFMDHSQISLALKRANDFPAVVDVLERMFGRDF